MSVTLKIIRRTILREEKKPLKVRILLLVIVKVQMCQSVASYHTLFYSTGEIIARKNNILKTPLYTMALIAPGRKSSFHM